MLSLISLAASRLAPAGRLIISWRQPEHGAAVLRYDPTLPPPLPAEYLEFACREAGFADVSVEARAGTIKLLVAIR